jgi:predicted DCC family thiol-disulfide oxidoreductase YuxK
VPSPSGRGGSEPDGSDRDGAARDRAARDRAARDGGSGGGSSSGGPVLLFDGVCALCNWTVRVVLRLDRRGRIRFAPLEGEYAARVLERHPEAREVDSMILVEPDAGPPGAGTERVHVKSDAVLRLAPLLGGPWRAAGVLRLVPRRARDWAYDVIARHRYALFGRLALRPDPPDASSGRFLD